MAQFLEFAGNHPMLFLAAAILIGMIIVTELRQQAGAAQLNTNDAVRLINDGALVLDVRGDHEFANGHILSARHIPLDALSTQVDKLKKYKDKPIIVCCDAGMVSGKAASILSKLGFTQLYRLKGGIKLWRQENLPVVKKGK